MIGLNPFVIWNLVLCTLGVQEVFRLPRWKAALVVLIPTVAQLLSYILFSFAFGGLFGSLGGLTPPPGQRPP